MQNEELVAAVLGHIVRMQDLLRCSAVSRCWRSATKILRPTSIEVPGFVSQDTDISFDDILQWLQKKHQLQYFDKLQNFSLSLSNYAADDQPTIAASGLAMLMLAGLWPLQACSISGHLDQIVGLLPHTLHHLHVQVDIDHREYHTIDIGIFQRFKSLRSLHLSTPESDKVAGFQMQSHMVLPNLRHLHLSPWPFKNHGTLADSLPLLTHAALHIEATDVKQYVKLPQIEYLGVQLVNLGNDVVHMRVRVNAESHLNCLVLSTPENVKVDFCLDKPDLLYRLRSSGGIRNVCSPTNLKRVYQLPKHFVALKM